jgi:hypothetical protein
MGVAEVEHWLGLNLGYDPAGVIAAKGTSGLTAQASVAGVVTRWYSPGDSPATTPLGALLISSSTEDSSMAPSLLIWCP